MLHCRYFGYFRFELGQLSSDICRAIARDLSSERSVLIFLRANVDTSSKMTPSPSSKVAVGMGTFALFALLGSRLVDVRPIAMHLRGATDTDFDADVPIKLQEAVTKWRSRVAETPELAKNIQELKDSHRARSNGRELRDHTIVRAMQRAKAKKPPRFSLEWAKRFEGQNPFEVSTNDQDTASDPDRESDFDRMRRNRQRRGQTTDQIIGIGLSALSPGFPWVSTFISKHTHAWSKQCAHDAFVSCVFNLSFMYWLCEFSRRQFYAPSPASPTCTLFFFARILIFWKTSSVTPIPIASNFIVPGLS